MPQNSGNSVLDYIYRKGREGAKAFFDKITNRKNRNPTSKTDTDPLIDWVEQTGREDAVDFLRQKGLDKSGKIENGKTISTTGEPRKSPKDLYSRPSHHRAGLKELVWELCKDADGKVRDPYTKAVMNFNEPWDMGHKPGYEFRKHQKSAKERGISRKEFLDEYNNPEHYRPELPSSNRSHATEIMTDEYFGP